MIFPVVDTNLIIISPCKVSFDVGLELCVYGLVIFCILALSVSLRLLLSVGKLESFFAQNKP